MLKQRAARVLGYLFFAVFLFALDQATKKIAYRGGFDNFLELFRPVFGSQIFSNADFAFSLVLPLAAIYVIYAVLLLGLWFWYFRGKRSFKESIAFILITAGAVSNIYDRIALGYVRDFIYIFWGNIFNFADIFIVSGIILFLSSGNKNGPAKS